MTEYKKFTNEDGEEVEGLSKEEFEAEAQKQKEEFETKETELNETIKKFEAKDLNFKALRGKSKEERETFLEKLDEKDKKFFLANEENSARIDEINSNRTQENQDIAVASLCGDDEELVKKVLANLELLNVEPKTKKEMVDKVTKAYNMSVDVKDRNPVLGVSRSTNEGDIVSKNKKPMSAEVKEIGKKMGISEEDIKKYGNK